jgi:hypothetical protein
MLGVLSIVMLLFGTVCFSFGISFERDCRRWKDQQRRRELGRTVLNTYKL